MKVRDDFAVFGVASGIRTLRLSARERATLARAANLLAAIRERATNAEDDPSEILTDIALAAYTCADLANEGRLDL